MAVFLEFDAEEIATMRSKGMQWSSIARDLNTNRQTLYDWCKRTGHSDNYKRGELFMRRIATAWHTDYDTLMDTFSRRYYDEHAAEILGISVGWWSRQRRAWQRRKT